MRQHLWMHPCTLLLSLGCFRLMVLFSNIQIMIECSVFTTLLSNLVGFLEPLLISNNITRCSYFIDSPFLLFRFNYKFHLFYFTDSITRFISNTFFTFTFTPMFNGTYRKSLHITRSFFPANRSSGCALYWGVHLHGFLWD